TALQMLNPTSSTITGNLVFHKQLQSPSPSDPSLPFALPPGQSLSYPDVVASMGTTGIGSLDILTTAGNAPIATARVFSDGGAAGRIHPEHVQRFRRPGLRLQLGDRQPHLGQHLPTGRH